MIIQTWKMALSAVFANKLRTFLTMLGIIIGVAALITLVSITDGATSSVSDRISSMGSSFLMVRVVDDKENPIKLGELKELFTDEEFGEYAPYGRSSVTGKTSLTDGSVNLYGTSSGYLDIMEKEIAYGRSLKQADLDNASHVIIITEDTAVEFFGRKNAVGEELSLNGKKFQVIGILAEDDSLTGSAMMSASSDSESTVTLEGYIPYSTYSRMSDNALNITNIYLAAAEGVSLDELEEKTEEIFLKRLSNDADAFSIQNQSEIMEAMEEVTNTMQLMLGGIAGISLLVGGIGIMNIMLVSVTERTREIGIRKAIGATRASILTQFLMEAIIVSLAGCVIGVGFSWLALKVIAIFMQGSMELSMNKTVVMISMMFSAVIGVVFGLYPAAKAANKKPIDALRHAG